MKLICGIAGPELSAFERTQIATGRVREIILFRRNIEFPQQLRRLIDQIHDLGAGVGIDHEGGRVHRFGPGFKGITHFPSVYDLLTHPRGIRGYAAIAAQQAAELCAYGFDAWYSPVADVRDSRGHSIIGDRSSGYSVERVVDVLGAFEAATADFGLQRCIKHFPGHGSFAVDSHVGLPIMPYDNFETHSRELEVYRSIADAGFERVMTAHFLAPALFEGGSWQSSYIVDLARSILGNAIEVITDDLAMAAVGGNVGYSRSVEGAVAGARNAGYDAALYCSPQATRSIYI